MRVHSINAIDYRIRLWGAEWTSVVSESLNKLFLELNLAGSHCRRKLTNRENIETGCHMALPLADTTNTPDFLRS